MKFEVKSPEDRLWQTLMYLSLCLKDRGFQRQSQESRNVIAKLTFRQHQVLRLVYILTRTQPEGVPLKKLAEQLQLSPGTVSEAVDKLVRKQMLKREICTTDRRSVHIRVSEQGMDTINLGIDQYRKDQKHLLELLSEEETRTLLTLLERLAENIPDLLQKPV